MRLIDADKLKEWFSNTFAEDDKIDNREICEVLDNAPTVATDTNVGNKYRWHDLRKDPTDLPKEDGIYLVAYDWCGRETVIVTEAYHLKHGFIMPPNFPRIGWKKIELFEVDE